MSTQNSNQTGGYKPSLLRHVVCFRFKPETTEEQIQEIVDAFRALPSQIEQIHDFEWGTDVSVEGIAQGYTHCFLVTFLSEEDRDAYLPHPAHKAFGEVLHPHRESVFVFDYWSRE